LCMVSSSFMVFWLLLLLLLHNCKKLYDFDDDSLLLGFEKLKLLLLDEPNECMWVSELPYIPIDVFWFSGLDSMFKIKRITFQIFSVQWFFQFETWTWTVPWMFPTIRLKAVLRSDLPEDPAFSTGGRPIFKYK
jgi:hypothetical protein